MVKKIMAGLLCGALALSMLAGCSSPKEEIFISTKEDLVGKKIGVQEGTTGDILVSEEVEKAEVSRWKKPVDAAMELKNGKIDAVVLDAMPAKKIVDSMEGLVILDDELSTETYAIAVKKGNTELLAKINETLARMISDGTIDTLYSTFIDGSAEISALPVVEEGKGANIVMGTNAEFEPFEYKGEGGKIIGFDVEMAKNIAKDLDRKLVIEDMAFDSLIMALESGKVDMILAGMTATDERRQSVDFSNDYFNASQVIIVRESSVKK